MKVSKYLIIFIIVFFSRLAFALPTQTALPLQFDTGNPAPYGMPSTIIIIQGKQVPIILDTGAKKSELVLSQHALENLRVKYTGKTECFMANDGKHCQKVFIVPEVKLGSFVLENVKGTKMSKLWGGGDDTFKETEASRNGIIGFALLSKFNLLLDYPNSKALLVQRGEKPSGYDINKWIPISFTGHFTGHLITPLYINGELRTISWDTGSIPSIIRKSAKDKIFPCPGDAPYSKKYCLSVITTKFTTEKNNLLPNTWFSVKDIPTYAPFDGLIGSNFYSENLVYFDFDAQQIFVKHAK